MKCRSNKDNVLYIIYCESFWSPWHLFLNMNKILEFQGFVVWSHWKPSLETVEQLSRNEHTWSGCTRRLEAITGLSTVAEAGAVSLLYTSACRCHILYCNRSLKHSDAARSPGALSLPLWSPDHEIRSQQRSGQRELTERRPQHARTWKDTVRRHRVVSSALKRSFAKSFFTIIMLTCRQCCWDYSKTAVQRPITDYSFSK